MYVAATIAVMAHVGLLELDPEPSFLSGLDRKERLEAVAPESVRF